MKLNVICPYCGAKNIVCHEQLYNDSHIVVCDVFKEGCDRMFVADVVVSADVKVLKIEGEENKTFD